MTATQPASARFVDRLAEKMGGRLNRRSFFTRTAVAGAALAVAPTDYVLKPGTAYAAICSCNNYNCDCGSLCCDGYTEFCCTLSGANQCPPGTRMGGWWKADGTGLCGPNAPRYYMDCNVDCGGCGCGGSGVCSGSCTGTPCGCMGGDCNNRKSGCVHFRYGQCNNQIACLGPILCRVVTCLPPWQIEPTCTTTVLVDQNTAFHDRPCLHRTIGSVESVTDTGSSLRVVGWALDYDTSAPIQVHVYMDGKGATVGTADLSRPDVANLYPGMGSAHGFDFTFPAGPGPHRIDVYAIGVGPNPTNVLIGSSTATVTSPFGAFDSVTSDYDSVRVTGWAIDPDTINPTSVHVYIDGAPAGSFTANGYRPDVGAAFPAWGNYHGYDIDVPVAPGTHTVSVYAINSAGVPAPNVLLGSRAFTVTAGPFGNLEVAAAVNPDKIRVRGWAIDPAGPSPIQVRVLVDGAVSTTVTANITRPDVGAAFPAFGADHGFDVTVPAPINATGSHAVEVVGVNVGTGSDTSFGKRTVQVGGLPGGAVDAVWAMPGAVRLVGWALDPDVIGAIPIHVWLDGAPVGAYTADLSRPDVGAVFPGYGDNHGFDVTIPVGAGDHVVNVYAINSGSGSSNALLSSRGVKVGGNPVGNFDEAIGGPGNVRVRGWALDPDVAAPIIVHVWVDGAPLTALTCDQSRPDIANAYPGYGPDHGFDAVLDLAPGTHQILVYGINTGTGTTNTFLGGKTVTVV